MKKLENLIKMGLGKHTRFLLARDLSNVKASFLGTKIFRRENELEPIDKIFEQAPNSADAFFIDRVEREKNNSLYYTIEYYEIQWK